MHTVFLASLRTHIRRYLAAAITVIVAVAFVVVVGVLTSGARSGLMDGFGAPYRNADHVVSTAVWPDEMDAKDVIAFVERHGENASATGRVNLPARCSFITRSPTDHAARRHRNLGRPPPRCCGRGADSHRPAVTQRRKGILLRARR